MRARGLGRWEGVKVKSEPRRRRIELNRLKEERYSGSDCEPMSEIIINQAR